MWIFTITPDWIVHLVTATGFAGIIAAFVLGFIPIISRYKLSIQIISILTFTFGVYLEGGLADNKEWMFKVGEMKEKVAEAEAEAANKNVEIQEKVVTKTQVIRERGRDIVKYIDRIVDKEVPGPERERTIEIIKYVENCPVPQEFIDQHNAAARLNKTAESQESKK